MTQPTVLVVDDNATTRKLLRTMLEAERCAVIEAADGLSALAHARRRLPDLIIQDLQLPDIDGVELVRRLRQVPAGDSVPIFALSGFLTRIDEARAIGSPFTAFLAKPLEPSRLLEAIEGYLPHKLEAPSELGAGRRVLIVDDDPVEQKLLRQLLTDRGFAVTGAFDSGAALTLARAQPPEVVVADLLMPGSDGFALCAALRRQPAFDRTAVILMSSHRVSDADRELARKVGANRLVARVAGGAEAIAAVLEAMDEGRALADRPADATSDSHVRRLVLELQREVDLNAGLRQKCALQAARISLFASIAEAVANKQEGELTIRTVLEQCLDAAGISHAVLLLRDPAGRLLLRHAVGYPVDDAAALEGELADNPAIDRILAEDSALPVGADVADADGRALSAILGVKSGLALPLVAYRQALGVLLLGSNETDVTAGEPRTFARILAAQLAQAVALHAAFAEMAKSEKRYRTIVEGTHDGVCTIDRGGRIAQVNRPLAAMLGYTPGELVGRGVGDIVPADLVDSFETLDHAADARDARLRRKDGAEIHVRLAANAVLDAAGTHLESVAVVTDLSDEKKRQAQLMASDRLASVGMLAAAVAHEINNPLASLVTNLDVAAEDIAALEHAAPALPLGDLVQQVSDARACAARVRQIVRDLKIFCRDDEQPRAPVDIEKVLESTVRIAWGEIRHRARLVRDYGRVPPVLANEPKLGQVFLNLLVNAAQSIREGASERNGITLVTRHDPAGRRVIVEVRDTGAGMSPDVMKNLFTPFFTTKPVGEGTGLGLPICQRIVTSLGGQILVESQPGVGSSFRVVMPIEESGGVARGTQPLPRVRVGCRGRILIVDDEEMICSALKRALRDHDVVTQTSGRAALELLGRDDRFDLILCDLMMPDLTGMELHEELARRRPETAARMIFFTGGAFTARARAFLEAIPNPRFEKPVDPLMLRGLIQDWLAEGGLRAGGAA